MSEAQAEELCGYLSRMLDRPVAIEDSVGLRSVQRAALSAWARKKGIALTAADVGSGKMLSVRSLIHPAVAPNSETAGALSRTLSPMTEADRGKPLYVGIDIEDVGALPRPDDYREDPFFQDHFSAAEIAYCIRQANVAASFCGLWAAKEAILKSGFLPVAAARLQAIEITHDANGRPVFDKCELSISHTSQSAIAICVFQRA